MKLGLGKNFVIYKIMLTDIHPKLPMRDKAVTRAFYIDQLGFQIFGSADYEGYLMVQKDEIQIHFFEFPELDPKENYGQVYIRTNDIDSLYQTALEKKMNTPCCRTFTSKALATKRILPTRSRQQSPNLRSKYNLK